MTLRVCKNPARAVGGKLVVVHPATRREYPDGVFEMSAADSVNPAVRRLFASHHDALPPGFHGLPGGVFGDLLVVVEETTGTTKKGSSK